MYIICGLGNPGKKYENTRHNLGFLTIDRIAESLSVKIGRSKFNALTGETRIAGEKVLLVKPQTYMNLSGEAVRDIVRFYKVPVENLIVIYDDFDLPLGTLRIRKFGSAGTHNGMRSVIYQLNSDRFPRIRIGIGEENRARDLVDFVIGGFSKESASIARESVIRAAEAAVSILEDGIDKAMNRFNTKNETSANE
ncbi:MAG: aminoacyl-tRNA hydrolase [Eubacterium sp.]|nr:aminoacyl-tRNA hydrolase [Eubacterium sp.]